MYRDLPRAGNSVPTLYYGIDDRFFMWLRNSVSLDEWLCPNSPPSDFHLFFTDRSADIDSCWYQSNQLQNFSAVTDVVATDSGVLYVMGVTNFDLVVYRLGVALKIEDATFNLNDLGFTGEMKD